MPDLSDRVALVTGASRGIGRAIALKLAERGADVVVHCRAELEAAAEVADEIAQKGSRAVVVRADLASPDGVGQLFSEIATSALGHRLDILVNNAAITSDVPFEAVGDGDYERVMRVNLKAPFFAAQRAAERMNGWGRIINIAALSAHRAYGAFPVYSMAKASIVAMTAALAQKLGSKGITVNAISPGTVATDMSTFILNDARAVERYTKATPLQRIGQPEDIAAVAAFLASDDGGWITGQTIIASGGMGL